MIKYSKKIANKKLIEKINAYEVIVLTPLTSDEYLVYALAKKLNKKVFILPNGYDFARKMPIPLNADKYFTYDSISTKFYLKYKIPSSLIQKLRYQFYSIIKKIKNKKISTQQISRGRKNSFELYKKLANSTKQFSSNRKINFRSMFPKNEFLKYLELNEKKSFLKAYSLFGNHSNFNDEDGINFNFEEKNSNYYDFISRTSILILFSASHAVIEYSLANKPVLVVYESKK